MSEICGNLAPLLGWCLALANDCKQWRNWRLSGEGGN